MCLPGVTTVLFLLYIRCWSRCLLWAGHRSCAYCWRHSGIVLTWRYPSTSHKDLQRNQLTTINCSSLGLTRRSKRHFVSEFICESTDSFMKTNQFPLMNSFCFLHVEQNFKRFLDSSFQKSRKSLSYSLEKLFYYANKDWVCLKTKGNFWKSIF